MSVLFPSDPNDRSRTQAEIRNWELEQTAKRKAERREAKRFWVTTIIAGIAALASVAGVIIQLVSG